MGKILFLLFTVVPLVEIYLLVGIGSRVGVWPTLAGVFLTGAVGAALAKREGLRVLVETQRALAEGRVPAEGVLGAVLVLAGGLLLIAPGVLTDVVGLLLLVPPTRRLIARGLGRWLERKVRDGTIHVGVGFPGAPRGPAPGPKPRLRREDVSDAEVVEPPAPPPAGGGGGQ